MLRQPFQKFLQSFSKKKLKGGKKRAKWKFVSLSLVSFEFPWQKDLSDLPGREQRQPWLLPPQSGWMARMAVPTAQVTALVTLITSPCAVTRDRLLPSPCAWGCVGSSVPSSYLTPCLTFLLPHGKPHSRAAGHPQKSKFPNSIN